MENGDNVNKGKPGEEAQKSAESTGNSEKSSDRIAEDIFAELSAKGQKDKTTAQASRDLTDEELKKLNQKFQEGIKSMKDHPWNKKGQ